jgi:hypothetical protein
MPKTANYAMEFEGLDVVLARLNDAQAQFRMFGGDVSPNYLIRNEALRIAETMVPDVSAAVRASPAPQAAKVSATVRAKRDRIPVVKIGATQPKLSGFRGRKPNKARHKGSVAWGVERGPGGGHRSGRGANFYKVPRNTGGYGIGPRMGRIGGSVIVEYRAAIANVLRAVGVL